MGQFFEELKRRNVFRVAIAYVIAAWLLIEISATTFPMLRLPEWTATFVTVLLMIGFPVALIFAWAYELTPEGLKKEKDVDRSESITHVTGRKLDFIIIGVLAVALIGVGGFWFMGRDARWARNEAFPRIEEYAEAGDWQAAYVLATKVAAVLPDDPTLAELWGTFSWITTIPSNPPGAKVFRRPYAATDAAWEELGTTPLQDIHFPFGLSLIRLELDGRPPLLRVLGGGVRDKSTLSVEETPYADFVNVNPEHYTLDTDETLPEGKVRVPGWTAGSDGQLIEFREFFIGRYEVTNREFKTFVDAGGYRRRDLWEHDFVQDGQAIPWEEAMALLMDKTGRPGPGSWAAGGYPDGEDDYPVAGVSWYEAATYARFVGQELPSVHHWRRAFSSGTLPWMLPASNLDGDALAPVGQFQGVGWTGTFDMLGNVREWCLNSTGDQRVILGGGWNEAYYMAAQTISDPGSMPPLDRSATNGFRLAITGDNSITAQWAQQPVPEPIDIPHEVPASDEVFAVYLNNYDYDPTPLNATIEATESARYWTRERISFDAVYEGERITLYLYLPRGEFSGYQTIIFWPGAGALWLESFDQARMPLDFALKNGRAVAFPVYKDTFDRRLPKRPSRTTIARRDLRIQQVKDLRRTIDYLESRADIDAGSLAFYGHSWGGYIGGLVLAVEPRLRVGILNQAGLGSGALPEIDVVHYLPRVNVPVLQFNGRFDTDFRLETSAKPFFALLGTPLADKKHVVEPTAHFAPQPVVIGETLNWLDKYLGPPNH